MVFSAEVAEEAFFALKGWQGDGIIAMITNKQDALQVSRLRCPVVNLSGALQKSGFPRVRPNYRQAGELAAEHLINRHFQQFGFFGIKGVWYSGEHRDGFLSRLQLHGFSAFVLEMKAGPKSFHSLKERIVKLENWVSSLKKPAGIYCVRDARAITLIEACHRVGLRVPQDVAVISFDNDATLCEACIPPLTSIERNDTKLGFEAARLLDQLIQGKEPLSREDIVVPVGQAVRRASTDTIGVANPQFAGVIEEIYKQYSRPVDFTLIAKRAGRSRRWLETGFRNWLQVSPHQFLNRLRLERAKALLQAYPELLIKDVATRCGFSSHKHLERVCRHFEGASNFLLLRNRKS
jgi:LacI family transcriptional regulator